MQKISPLRAGLDAFNRFRSNRIQAKTEKLENINSNSTNPFGISFKGTVIQMDVFESSTKKNSTTNSLKDGLDRVNKFVASARVATMNKIESIKQGAISFGNRVKDNVVNTYNKLNSIEVNFDFLRNSTSRLQKRPVTELEEMFRSELNGLEA